jgi:dihydroorotate dehydrogenase (NAD+) catalytic subunit
MPDPDLSCEFLNLQFRNPIVLCSGVIGTSVNLLRRAAQVGAGGVIAKSCSLMPRAGHPNPVTIDWGEGIINAIGLTNPGAETEVSMLKAAREALEPAGVPVIASIFGGTVEEYREVAKVISRANPHLIEVNISCPNVADEFGTPFSGSCESAAQVTAAVKNATTIPISVKLAPNVPSIGRIAAAVVEAGADAVTAINTMPGMVIDAEAGRAVLANKTGGISGKALKPIALRCVSEIARAVKVPIIGTGGIATGRDAVEMIMAGATLVGVGTAVWYRGVEGLGEIARELEEFMRKEMYLKIEEMRGLVNR